MLDFLAEIESSVRGYVRSFPAIFSSSSGCWIYDNQGKKYLDFFSGAGALNYGHNPPLVKAALIEYISNDGVLHSLDMATEAKLEFLKAFDETILKPRKLRYKLQFTGPTGTNAVEAAIKLARKIKQRSHIVAFTNAYHGHSLGSLALTGNRYYHNEHFGSHNNVTHLPFDGYMGQSDTTKLFEKMLQDSSSGLPLPAAVIVETVQGEGGIRVASNQWLQNLQRICQYNDILLIVDEIQVGNGRTGSFFSFEPSGIKPSMVCLSKSIGGGLPMSLVLIQPELDAWQPGEHTGTFRGNNLAFVAARECLRYWEDDGFQKSIAVLARTIGTRLHSIASQLGSLKAQVRGRGLIWGLDVRSGQLAKRISKRAFELGLIIETAGADDEILKFLPPLVISVADLNHGLNIFQQAIADVLEIHPSTTGFVQLPRNEASPSESPSNEPTVCQNAIR